jgi:hypothetical protein
VRDGFADRYDDAQPNAAEVLHDDWNRMRASYDHPKSTGGT